MKIKLLVVGLLSIFLVSCEDSGVVPQKITVNGTVGFDFGFAENYKIEINGKIATSDINGNFSFENVDIPYDLKILSTDGNVIVYKSLSSASPFLNVTVNSPQNLNNSFYSTVVVTSNVISINKKTKIFFIPDKEDARVYGNFLGNVAGSGSQASVYWNGTNTVMGKIAVLVYTTGLIPTLKVVSYDRLYEINNVQLTNGVTTQLNIDSSFTFTDPVERNITVNINEFSGTNPAIVRLCLRAQNYIQAEPFESLESSYPNGLYSTIIPEAIPEYFTFYLKGDKFGTAFEMSRGIQSLSTNSSTQLLNIYKPVGFSSPAQNGAVTLYGGQFSWESSEGTGIYELGIALQSDNKLIKIFTTSINTTIPDLSALGFSYQGNGQHAVYDVKKYYGPGGIDDFTKENYFRSELNKGQSTSSYIDISVN